MTDPTSLGQPHASSSTSTSHIKHYKPYFSPRDVERLSAKQRGKLSVSREERGRQQACGFIDATGVRCGFPRRTIASAQSLYMRFHLFFPYKDFNYVEVSLSCLYVASKLHDTLKKPRDIILSSYPLRYPQFVKKGSLDLTALDPRMLEDERAKVLGVERLILETICFKFGVDVGLAGVVKIGKALGLNKFMCRQAWRVAVDSYRTQASLSYPPHIIAIASIYTSCILALESAFLKRQSQSQAEAGSASGNGVATSESQDMEIVDLLSKKGGWEDDYSATADQVDDVVHYLLDLYITILSLPSDHAPGATQPSPVSPKDPSLLATSSAAGASNSGGTTPSLASSTSGTTSNPAGMAFPISGYWTSQTLTEVKIKLREKRPGHALASSYGSFKEMGWNPGTDDPAGGKREKEVDEATEGMGQNNKTIRFLWTASTT